MVVVVLGLRCWWAAQYFRKFYCTCNESHFSFSHSSNPRGLTHQIIISCWLNERATSCIFWSLAHSLVIRECSIIIIIITYLSKYLLTCVFVHMRCVCTSGWTCVVQNWELNICIFPRRECMWDLNPELTWSYLLMSCFVSFVFDRVGMLVSFFWQ